MSNINHSHKNRKQVVLICLLLFGLQNVGMSQFGYGFTGNLDFYQRYVNPQSTTNDVYSRSAGSALLNLGLGPKIWLGGKKTSVSLEAMAVLGALGLSTKDYKGLGMVAFPIMAKLNFKGLSSFDKEGKLGFSIGGGIQYSKTEIFGLTDDFVTNGVTRSYFQTYIVQAGYGFGLSGFTAHGFTRYGFNPDTESSTLNIGIQIDINVPMIKKISNPESEL